MVDHAEFAGDIRTRSLVTSILNDGDSAVVDLSYAPENQDSALSHFHPLIMMSRSAD